MNKRYSVPGLTLLERKKQYSDPSEAIATEICCRVGSVLKFHYPLHMWQVGIVGDLLYIKAMNLNRMRGYRLPVREIITVGGKQDDRVIMRAGGEILERFGVKRGKLTLEDNYSIPRDIRQEGIEL